MKKILLLTLSLLLLAVIVEGGEDTMTNVTNYANIATFGSASKIQWDDGDSEYIIDAAGFKSLTNDEAIKLSVAILLCQNLLSTDLRQAIYEKFIPIRFKVQKEIK